MLKWTLCIVFGEVSAPERVEIRDCLQSRDRRPRPPPRTARPTAKPAPPRAKGRGRPPETAAAAVAGPPGSARFNRTSKSSSAATHRSTKLELRERRLVDLAQKPEVSRRRSTARQSCPRRTARSRPAAPRAAPLTCSPSSRASTTPFMPRKSLPETSARCVGSSGSAWPGAGKIDVGDLEEIGVGLAVRLVVQPGGQQAGDQALPQGRLALAAGMIDPQRRGRRARAAPARPAGRRPG